MPVETKTTLSSLIVQQVEDHPREISTQMDGATT